MTATQSTFDYSPLPGRVVFGVGAIRQLPRLLAEQGGRRITIVDGRPATGLADWLRDELGASYATTVPVERQHVPAEIALTAQETAVQVGTDFLVSVGGGSALGVAKAIAHATALPIAAVPTTYAGSEMTPIWGTTNSAGKVVGHDLRVLPKLVVYDPELSVGLSRAASSASGMNAIAHCVEALWTERRNPLTDAIATEGIGLLAGALGAVVDNPSDVTARSRALKGAWLSGMALANAGTALHHKICHVLGGTFDLPHAETHAAVLAAVVAHFQPSQAAVCERIARALDADDAHIGLQLLRSRIGATATLADLGLSVEDADRCADVVAATHPVVPTPIGRDEIRSILAAAM